MPEVTLDMSVVLEKRHDLGSFFKNVDATENGTKIGEP
jgi:hypothetical protein